jgi:chloramphenicol 3-O-phosphotransferase
VSDAGGGGVLVYLYGPPAAGKLTVASALVERTGIRLFHNHLTVNALRPVFDFGTAPFAEVLHRWRLDVFATAAARGVDVAFTNNSAWSGADARDRFAAFAASAADVVAAAGGRTVFVHVTAPTPVLEARVADESRRAHGKLVEVGRLRELLASLDPSPLHDGDLLIDTSRVTPADAAAVIADAAGVTPRT